MGWADLERTDDDDQVQRRRSEMEALQADVRLALKDNAPLVKYLKRLSLGASYAPGRSPEQVAHAEGARGLAVKLLQLGGIYD
jgi:hypothetical protein